MKIESITLYQLKLPCVNTFVHAMSSRDSSEVILVKILWTENMESWGEMLPRSYVTGESIEGIMDFDYTSLLSDLMQIEIESVDAVVNWTKPLIVQNRSYLSFIGGVEVALLDALSQKNMLALGELLGPVRTRAIGRCVTVGFDCAPDQIRARFIDARLKKATAIKLKVGRNLQRDTDCASQLIKLCGSNIDLRLDGNGSYSFDSASEFLSGIDTSALHSFEEPLMLDIPNLPEQLKALKRLFDIELMADEALCSEADADVLIQSGHYQWFNIRIGKHGGLLASMRIRDKALSAGIKVVGGSMVGETTVLTQASAVFLQRSEDIDYIEGLGQNRTWLSQDPMINTEVLPFNFNQLQADKSVFDQCLIKTRHYCH
jgi:L-alanine-DL-glutamate epimerase-like enolase superfamily enzyme